MYYRFLFFIFFNYFICNQGFINKKILPNIHTNIHMKPVDIIKYITSFRDYTIVTNSEDYKDLYYFLKSKDLNIYYANINNMLEKEEILKILQKNYKNFETSANLWIFYKGYFIGSNEIIEKLKKKYN